MMTHMTDAVPRRPASAYLEVRGGAPAQRYFTLAAETLIGRNDEDFSLPEDSIGLSDSRVSRYHARIFQSNGRFYLEDTHSTNGTFLNAFRLTPGTPYVLRDGSNIQVGGVYLRFRPAAVAQAPGSSERSSGYSSDYPSEIGRNEEFFDFSLTPANADGERAADVSMLFRAPEMTSPEISAVLDVSEVMEQLHIAQTDTTESNSQLLRRLRAMVQVSIGLGTESSREALFARIMAVIFDIFPTAERAFVVLRDRRGEGVAGFHPAAASTRTPGAENTVLVLSEVIVDEVVGQRRSILSTDVMDDQRFKGQESISQLGLRSVMCVPLLVEAEVIGLIQIDTHRQTHSFDQEDLQILTGIGAQVAVALKNFGLYEDIEQLFEGFVTASVHAIEERDPATAGHSFRVAEYSQRLAQAVDGSQHQALRDIRFSLEQIRELRYAALLHDFGKVGVREHVLIKARKLYHSQLDVLQERFRYARASLERQAYRELVYQHSELSPAEFRRHRGAVEARLKLEAGRLQRFMAIIRHANEPSVIDDQVNGELQAVADFVFPGEQGEAVALLNTAEFEALTLARGSLTPDERLDIQSHVSHTFSFLSHIPWTGSLAAVADIAHAHHEKLDGSGYPQGLKGDEIPIPARVMTVADIFDALTAGDRPYKRSLSVDKALDLLKHEAAHGKIDPLLVEVFIDSQAYRLFDRP
ncbi:MAG: HD domain-containing phosphohydrolase [Gammaproteobacteria bacterium]|nr:HD domain-containing phosphohydrolase [Gammaproteobacteria bacterium]